MLYYKPQRLNPNRHEKMPEEYPWIIAASKEDVDYIEISEEEYQTLLNTISLVEYNQALLLEGSIGDYLKQAEINPLKVTVSTPITNTPFSNKTIETSEGIKKLYKRIIGLQQDVTIGLNTIVYSIPYNWVKITGIEFINGENLDFVSLFVCDDSNGTYSKVPNYKLNQFGFNVNLCTNLYSWSSSYDADLYLNMVIKVEYNSATTKKIGINFQFNEVK